MDRPTILLATRDDTDAQVGALERAGFEPLIVDPAHVDGLPPIDLAVIDCDIAQDAVVNLYRRLHAARPTPTLLLVGEGTALPDGVGAAGDEVALALKPIPPEALVQFVVGAYTGLLRWWLDSSTPVTPEELHRIARALRRVGFCELVIFVVGQAGIAHPFDGAVRRQMFRDG